VDDGRFETRTDFVEVLFFIQEPRRREKKRERGYLPQIVPVFQQLRNVNAIGTVTLALEKKKIHTSEISLIFDCLIYIYNLVDLCCCD